METGKWKMESGKWKVESGNWKLESGKWKVEIHFRLQIFFEGYKPPVANRQ